MSDLCSLKTALLLEYTTAAKNHCDAVNELHDRLDVGSSKETRDELYKTAAQHREAVEQARLKLDQHTLDHGC